MKLEAVCNTCRRRFLLTEILPPPEGSGGRCPFCGTHFARHYVAALPDLVRSVEAAADTFASSAIGWGHAILASVQYSDARRAFNDAITACAEAAGNA